MLSTSGTLYPYTCSNKCVSSTFFQYTPAIDIWSIGCIFAELLTGKPLFPGKNVVHQLDLMTDLLGTPSSEAIARVCFLWFFCCICKIVVLIFFNLYILFTFCSQIRNEKARRYLSTMRKKKPVPFSHKFPNADPLALRLLERMLAFDPKDRPNAEEVRFIFYCVVSSLGKSICLQLLKVHIVCKPSGSCRSIFQELGQSWERTFSSAGLKNGIWIWKT